MNAMGSAKVYYLTGLHFCRLEKCLFLSSRMLPAKTYKQPTNLNATFTQPTNNLNATYRQPKCNLHTTYTTVHTNTHKHLHNNPHSNLNKSCTEGTARREPADLATAHLVR